MAISAILSLAGTISPAQTEDDAPSRCVSSYSASARVEGNSNLFQLASEIEKDSKVVTTFTGQFDCAAGADDYYSLYLRRESNDFKRFRTESHTVSDFSFEYGFGNLIGDWLAVSADANRVESDDDALVEPYSRTNSLKVSVGKSFSKKSSAEIFLKHERETYRTLDSNNSDADSVGAVYTYDIGGFSYVETAFVKETANYPNNFLLDSDYNDTAVTRDDTAMSFSVTVVKTFNIFPLEYLEVTAESARNSSTGNTAYEWFDPDTIEPFFKIVTGYDDYDEDTLSAWYTRGLNEKVSLSLYYMHDRTTYGGVFLSDSYYEEPTVPISNTMKYYLGGIQFTLSDGWSLDASASEVRNTSNEPAYNYVQKIYGLGLTLSR